MYVCKKDIEKLKKEESLLKRPNFAISTYCLSNKGLT